MPLNHRKTSRMRVETTMRAHSRPRGERWLAVSQAENLFPVRRNLIYVGGSVFSVLASRLFHNPRRLTRLLASNRKNYFRGFGLGLNSDRYGRKVSSSDLRPLSSHPWISYYGFHGMKSNRLGDQVECSITCWAGSNLIGHNRESMF